MEQALTRAATIDEGRRHSVVVAAGLAGAIAIACALRFVLLTDDSLWGDEGFSVSVARLGLIDIVRTAANADTHPPLFYGLLHYWMAVFGDSELAVRFLPAVIGVLTVPVAYLLGSALAGRAAGLGAAYLVAVSPMQVFYSQEVRMYSLLALTAGLSSLFLVYLSRSPSKLLVLAYALTTTAMLYSHVYGLFVLCAQALYVVAAWRWRGLQGSVLRSWVVGAAGAMVLFAPWGVALAKQGSNEVGGEPRLGWLGQPGLAGARDTLKDWAGSSVGAVVLCCIALGVTLIVLVRRGGARPAGERGDAVLFLVLLTAVPILLPVVLSYVTPFHLYLSRYTVASALTTAVLIAVLAARFRPAVRTGLLVAFCATLLAGTVLYHAQNQKPDWRSAVAYLEQHAGPNDLIIIEPDWKRRVFDYYAPAGLGEVQSGAELVSEAQLEATRARGGSVWILGETVDVPPADVTARLDGLFGTPETIPFYGLRALHHAAAGAS